MRNVLSFTVVVAVAALIASGRWLYSVNAVDTPKYKVVMQEGAIEVRDYPALHVAEVATKGNPGQGVQSGVRPLANYIFAKERDGASIVMTAPATRRATIQFLGVANDALITEQKIILRT